MKTILDHPRNWNDFAFHDPVMFETLRKLVVDVESGMTDEELTDMCLYFAVDLPVEEVKSGRIFTRPLCSASVFLGWKFHRISSARTDCSRDSPEYLRVHQECH